MINAWNLTPGMVITVPDHGERMIMVVDHRPRFDAIFVTFDDGMTVRMLPGALVNTL
jgi:flagellar motor switch protein FliM